MMWDIKHKSGCVLFVTSDEFIAENRRKMGWIVEKVKMTSREQFEAWLYQQRVRGINFNIDKFDVDGEIYYKSTEIQGQWNAWQASRAAIEVELPEPCSPGDFCIDMPAQAHHEVVEAIESSGLKVKK